MPIPTSPAGSSSSSRSTPRRFVRDDLSSILARGIEGAVYNGTGTPQPTGILQSPSITNVVALGTNGAAPTFSAMVQLEELLGKGNADMGNLAYVTTAAGKGTLKQTPLQGLSQTSYVPKMIWGGQRGQRLPKPTTPTSCRAT